MSRTKLVALVATLTVVVLLGSWFSAGWQSASFEAKRLRETPERKAQQALSEVAMALANRLDSLRSKEDTRPYYHYQNLFHDPRGLSAGDSIHPSPLARDTGDPLIEAHFQVGGTGRLSIPPINEELPQFSEQGKLADNQAILRKLRLAKDELCGTKGLVASAAAHMSSSSIDSTRVTKVVPSAQRQAPVQQQEFSNQAFAQNVAPNAVFMDLEGRKKKISSASKGEGTSPNKPVEVLTHGFIWNAASIEGRSELVAIRRVETPSGTLHQGFLIGAKQVGAWIGQRGGTSMTLSLSHESAIDAEVQSISVPALDNWNLSVDVRPAQLLADAEADSLQSGFLWRFGSTAAITGLLLAFLIVTVARAERLALERSQFAAAAAHELRTPLAGLQLYGDMLAEGLGNESAKEKYARHISDEAQRLGRVVSNVLGLSQMERNGMRLDTKEANLSKATVDIVERMRPTLEQAGMTIEVEIPEGVQARFDEDAVSRILQNLLDNSEKYTRGHKNRRVLVEIERNSHAAIVRIADGGPGLSRKMRHQVFKPYRRNTDKDGAAGLGLGLALARALAQQQGGELRVEDSPLGGVTFVLELPLDTSL